MKKLVKSLVPKFMLDWYRSQKHKKQIAQFSGSKVECPICNTTFRIFASAGVVSRENAVCHQCGSSERHRLIWKYMRSQLDLFNQKQPIRLLHFAPEKMFYDIFSEMKNVSYVPCDISPATYHYKNGVEVIKVDITDIPFASESFDFVLATHVLEHIPNDQLAMSELFRVMKKGGSGIFQVPIDYSLEETYEDFSITAPEDRELAFGQFDHVRWYGQDYKTRLEKVGFKVTEDDYVKSFSKEDRYKYGLMASEMVYLCEKK